MPLDKPPLGDVAKSILTSLWSSCYLYLLRQNRPEDTHTLRNDLKFENDEDKCKARFLEEFAWILATDPGANYVTAVCFDQNVDKTGSIRLRVARNKKIEDTEFVLIQQFLTGFKTHSRSDSSEPAKFQAVLLEIIRLKRRKLIHYASKVLMLLSNIKMFWQLQNQVQEIKARLENLEDDLATSRIYTLAETVQALLTENPAVFATSPVSKLRDELKKLTRCNKSAQALLDFATQYSSRLSNMEVRRIHYSPCLKDANNREMSFNDLMRTVRQRDAPPAEILELERGISQSAEEVNKKCLDAWQSGFIHAEMQILAFYDFNPGVQASPNYIGISKFSCYCCHKILSDSQFQSNGSHQKVYYKWRAPVFEKPSLAQAERTWVTRLETLAQHNLDEIRQHLNRVNSPDYQPRSRVERCAESITSGISNRILHDSTKPLTPVPLQFEVSNTTLLPQAEVETRISRSSSVQSLVNDRGKRASPVMVSKYDGMVLLLYHLREPWKRDIISVTDLVQSVKDDQESLPRWERLLDHINDAGTDAFQWDDELKFDSKKEVIVLEKKIIVTKKRQLIPALDYFANTGELNIHGIICDRTELRYLREDRLLLC